MPTPIQDAQRRHTILPRFKLSSVAESLKHRNFRLFFCSYLISLTGIWIHWVTQMWLIFKLTQSPFLLGCLSFAGNIPIFMFAPIGGAIADRVTRRHVLLVTQSVAMLLSFVLALLTLSDSLEVWHLFAFAVLIGTNNAFDIPTHQSFLVDMVGKEDLMNAIALNSSLINCTRIIGPAIAGILLGKVGSGWCFLINSLSFIPAIAGILLMRELPKKPVRRPISFFKDISEGFGYARSHPPVRYVLVLIGLLSLMGMSYTVLLPVHADQVLDRGPEGLGQLIGVSGGGSLLAALVFAGYRNTKNLGQWLIISSMVFSLALASLSFSSSFWLSLVLLFMLGFSQVAHLDVSNKLIQLTVPDHMRGRIMSSYILVSMGMTPFGALLAGGFARRFGASATMLIFGSVYLLFGCAVGSRLLSYSAKLSRPGFRSKGSQDNMTTTT